MNPTFSLRNIKTEQVWLFAAIFFFYVLTGLIGLTLQSVNTFATLIWAPSGIAFAAYLLYGYRVWPAILLAAFVINASLGAPLFVALVTAFGNTFGPLLGATFVKWYTGHDDLRALRLRGNIAIIASAFGVPLITATIGVGSLWFGGLVSSGAVGATWGTWWIGDMLGILVCAPFLLKWLDTSPSKRTSLGYFELFLSSTAVAAFSYGIFWLSYSSFVYGLFIPLTWAALRTGSRGMTLSLLLVAVVATSGTLAGHGPFATSGLLQLQIFLATMSIVFLIFTAVVEERTNMLESLQQHANELENAVYKIGAEDEAKKEFLAILAHELRNPLATILSSIELIHMEGVSAANATALLENIGDRARAMVHLLGDLLDISRISQKKLTLHKKTLQVDAVLDKLIHTIQPLIAKYGHKFTITRPAEELTLSADPIRIEQIFMNLVMNAVKFTKSPGSIDIVIRRENRMVATSIRDNGIGIPKHMVKRIFEPFFQIKNGQSNPEGMGIGLPLTRHLIEMHGGTIEVKSGGANAGSEFIVRLPLLGYKARGKTASSPALVRGELPRKFRRTKQGLRILLVDDNTQATEALARLLELRGHTPFVASDGTEALLRTKQIKPEVILLDIGLPGMDGYEVATRLRALGDPYFLVALTGYGQVEDKERARQAGFDLHLTKPIGLKEIEAALRKIPTAPEKVASPMNPAQALSR